LSSYSPIEFAFFYLPQQFVCLRVVVPNARLVCVQQVFIEHVFNVDYIVMRGPHPTAGAGLWVIHFGFLRGWRGRLQ